MPSVSDPPKPGLRERKKARTRAAIQSHALRLFREQGYHATTIEQIIAAADVSESTLFRYFPTKEDLVLQDDYDPLIIEALRAQPPEVAPVAAIRAALAAVFGGMSQAQRTEQNERVALVLSVPAVRARMLDQFLQAARDLGEAIAERARRRPDDFAVRTVAGAVVGAFLAGLDTVADSPDADLGALIDQALAHLENGLTL
ncbi:MAG: TetR family transcriptional regulator [Mycobacteriaceae bacterium]|nr:TetR family transcriptional regulator [Mycobacteriaceae bacterium]MBV9640325.1 TetR family transcriptional regulator [Mycobacteriaceae bacterium]